MIFVRAGGKEAVLLRTNDRYVESKPQSQSAQGQAQGSAPGATGGTRAVSAILKGERIDLGLRAMAMAEGWEFIWYPTDSWLAINDIPLSQYKDAAEAVIDIIDGLREEGKPVAYHISDGNRVIEILSTEVKND
jgi:hypothetical protein